jgi:hypothetical protein
MGLGALYLSHFRASFGDGHFFISDTMGRWRFCFAWIRELLNSIVHFILCAIQLLLENCLWCGAYANSLCELQLLEMSPCRELEKPWVFRTPSVPASACRCLFMIPLKRKGGPAQFLVKVGDAGVIYFLSSSSSSTSMSSEWLSGC